MKDQAPANDANPDDNHRANADANHPADASQDESDAVSEVARQQLTATAFHEAGHAVMAWSLGFLIQKVTIAPGKSQFGPARLGACELRKGRTKTSHDQVEDQALILIAGMVAEARFTGHYCQRGAGQDLMGIERLLQHRVRNATQLERLQRRLLDKAEHQLGDAAHAQAIEWIAAELLQKTTISGRAVRHLFEQAQQRVKADRRG